MRNALKQGAAVVLVCDSTEHRLPDEVEIQPLSMVGDVFGWSDFIAFDVARENLMELKQMIGTQNQPSSRRGAQALIRTPMPCGGVAECGVCAVPLKSNWKLSCKDGPVFDWQEL
jgi:hypothetical protein